ncbi:MAG: ribonuclease catalytic domain-containing protein [Anaerolineae bacterium]|jgi:exoribonuclease-2
MTDLSLRRDGLVLYKARPARVRGLGKKIEIELDAGEILSVRPKDVEVLHTGPCGSLSELSTQVGEVETAWELLAGQTTNLADLAELIYGDHTPATAWAAWQLVDDGLYFRGTPAAVVARTAEEVAQEQEAREARAAQEEARSAFLERVRAGAVLPEDGPFVRRIEDFALGRRRHSRLLRDLGRAETPEVAHALLLELGAWDGSVDPYPQRLGLPTAAPEVELPDLAEEPRLDLTHLPAFAIDDEGNQEPDDALSLEGERLWVHVADVAALLPPNSTADLEARARGATLYLPEGGVPMLPWAAIRRLGLGLAEISPALSFGLDLDAAGEVAGVEIVPSWVRVTRLTYEEAEERLDEEPLRSFHRLAGVARARRVERGAILLDLPEVKIDVQNGEVRIRPLPPLHSRQLVTEAMLLAGEAVGHFALERGLPIPFTTQDPPETDERPGDLAGMFGLRRSLKPSEPSSMPGSHASLGLGLYVQATSPLRRYLDLVVHQQLRAHLRGEGLLDAQEVLARVGATAAVSGSVRQAERLARRHWTLVYLMQRPGWRGEGVLVEQRGSRGTLLIPELDLDARVHLRGDLPPNSLVTLALRQVRLPTLEVYFRVVR